jgi:glycosyltransferase involved in cell wall biosynthesis
MSRNIIPLLPHKDWEVSAPDRPRLLAMRALVVLWARLARRTICVSQDARARLARVAGVDASSIPVIPHGVESIDPSVPCVSPDLEALRSGPYILHVGQPTAYRRTKQLFEAYASLVASGEDVPPLFVAGRARPSDVGYERECLRILEPALRRERARMLGQVKHDDVLALMSKAHTFVYPSVHENCPNVVLEALAAGRVSVYADIAPVRELADDAALYVPNPSGPELASAIRIATSDDVSRRSLSARAVERAAQFTWERTADSTAAVLDDAFRASSGNQAARN